VKREGVFHLVTLQYASLLAMFGAVIGLEANALVAATAASLILSLGAVAAFRSGATIGDTFLSYRNPGFGSIRRIPLDQIVALRLDNPPVWTNGFARILYVSCRTGKSKPIYPLGVEGPRYPFSFSTRMSAVHGPVLSELSKRTMCTIEEND
jgi:hypothetical protein